MNNLFKSEWVEKCVRRVLGKPEGAISKEEISKIKYAKAGGDFSGSLVLELSTSIPPEPFAAFDGGDEWAVCLHSDTTLGEKYKLEDYIETNDGFSIGHFNIDEWKYAYSGEARQAWDEFEKSIVKNDISCDYTREEINAIEEENPPYEKFLLPAEDLALLNGLVVLRLYEMEIESVEWFNTFEELKVLELAETEIEKDAENAGAFYGLKQITIWCD